jgi:hypothetical protein
MLFLGFTSCPRGLEAASLQGQNPHFSQKTREMGHPARLGLPLEEEVIGLGRFDFARGQAHPFFVLAGTMLTEAAPVFAGFEEPALS